MMHFIASSDFSMKCALLVVGAIGDLNALANNNIAQPKTIAEIDAYGSGCIAVVVKELCWTQTKGIGARLVVLDVGIDQGGLRFSEYRGIRKLMEFVVCKEQAAIDHGVGIDVIVFDVNDGNRNAIVLHPKVFIVRVEFGIPRKKTKVVMDLESIQVLNDVSDSPRLKRRRLIWFGWKLMVLKFVPKEIGGELGGVQMKIHRVQLAIGMAMQKCCQQQQIEMFHVVF